MSGKTTDHDEAKEALKQLHTLYRNKAWEMHHDEGEIEIDDGATVSITDDGDGAYVQAWVWVSKADLDIDEDDEEGGDDD